MGPNVVVVGAGNAALCAAIAAREAGASVTVLEAAPREQAGGNSAFTAGAMRVAYRGPDDLARLLGDVPADCDFGSYPATSFVDDIDKVTRGRCDAENASLIAGRSLDTLAWMRSQGVAFEPAYSTQAFRDGERWRFWGGLPVRTRGEGKGLIASLSAACARSGVDILYGTRAVSLEDGAVVTESGVVEADAVVLACGGFEANPDWRAQYLGAGWERAKVRGTRFNVGDGIRMAIERGAARHGDWSGCHAVAWDAGAPDSGDLGVAHEHTRNSYQFGIVVDADGRRFLDEGADFRNYTYAAYGRELLRRPGWQVFDAKATPYLRREYFREDASRVEARTVAGLAALMHAPALVETVERFNAAIQDRVPFDPAALDGRGTSGVDPAKSNWAQALDTPPFSAWATCCGITFTFGGLRVDTSARVLDVAGRPVPALFAAGELVGGLWYGNYPGGAGLTAGSVLGRIAGAAAATA